MQAHVLSSQDIYLHISIGRWILAHHSVPDHGIFSGSIPNAPWVAHEWLAAVFYALLHDHYGWGGVLVGVALVIAIAIAVLAAETSPTLGPLGAICAAGLAWGLCIQHLVSRPHIATMALVVVWIAVHVRARHNDRVPPLYFALLMTLWANLHGAFFFGLVFTALFAGEALYESDTFERARTAAIRWGMFFGASVLAAAITPHGVSGLLFPIQLLGQSAALDTVYEWAPSTVVNNQPLMLWSFSLLFAALLTGISLPICRLLMLMLLLYMAFAHRRHTELLGLVAPLLLQHTIANAIPSSARSLTMSWGVLARPWVDLSVIGLSLLVALVVGFLGSRHATRGPDKFTPVAALNAVVAHGIPGPVLNERNYGGYLIYRGVPPFIDGRVDMYGDAFLLRYSTIDQLPGLLEQHKIAWTIFWTGNPRTTIMDHLPGWTRFYSDDWTVVHFREAATK